MLAAAATQSDGLPQLIPTRRCNEIGRRDRCHVAPPLVLRSAKANVPAGALVTATHVAVIVHASPYMNGPSFFADAGTQSRCERAQVIPPSREPNAIPPKSLLFRASIAHSDAVAHAISRKLAPLNGKAIRRQLRPASMDR